MNDEIEVGEVVTEEEGNNRLERAMEASPAMLISGIDVHGATFGEGSEEHAMCVVTFYVEGPEGIGCFNFVLPPEAAVGLRQGMVEVVPLLQKKEAELRKVRN